MAKECICTKRKTASTGVMGISGMALYHHHMASWAEALISAFFMDQGLKGLCVFSLLFRYRCISRIERKSAKGKNLIS
jgi:hypothetical protein